MVKRSAVSLLSYFYIPITVVLFCATPARGRWLILQKFKKPHRGWHGMQYLQFCDIKVLGKNCPFYPTVLEKCLYFAYVVGNG